MNTTNGRGLITINMIMININVTVKLRDIPISIIIR